MNSIAKIRNIGILAHIDSGKTTLTERILYYCKKINRIGEVHGKGRHATMDHMELEKERGITITSAATTVEWAGTEGKGVYYGRGEFGDIKINIIDTPGHVDFTVEVERSLRVLDGAILVICSVAGVQSQSITVDRQMKRYDVPCLVFLNKMDRAGANAYKCLRDLQSKLDRKAVLMQVPIGEGEDFSGIIDLVFMRAFYFEGLCGEEVRETDIPQIFHKQAKEEREKMLDVISEFSDSLTEKILMEEEISPLDIFQAVKDGVTSSQLTPVFVGTAYKNKGIQLLLDAVARYLPSPVTAKRQQAFPINSDRSFELLPDNNKPLVCMAFKINDEKFGQLVYSRIFQGKLSKGMAIYNTRTKKKNRVGRIVRMHADDRENILSADCGDIVAMVGIDCASGDTFVGDIQDINISCESIHLPIPVIELSVNTRDREQHEIMMRGLRRFIKEDPTFHLYTDDESGETRIAGMGELHLEIYIERLIREYKIRVETGPPQVNYRETILKEASFNYIHKKQTGGAGQFAQVVGVIVPLIEEHKGKDDQIFLFTNQIKGGSIPTEYIDACQRGFQEGLEKGPLAQYPLIDIEVRLQDGKHHEVDSSDMAFRIACKNALIQSVENAHPTILEPLMKVEVETTNQYQGSVIADLSSRRGIIQNVANSDRGEVIIKVLVPLSNMFGYSTVLRSLTSGQANYLMEFDKYIECPQHICEKIIANRKTKGAKNR